MIELRNQANEILKEYGFEENEIDENKINIVIGYLICLNDIVNVHESIVDNVFDYEIKTLEKIINEILDKYICYLKHDLEVNMNNDLMEIIDNEVN